MVDVWIMIWMVTGIPVLHLALVIVSKVLDGRQPRRRPSGWGNGLEVELTDLRRQETRPTSGDEVNNEMDHLRLSRKPGRDRCNIIYRQMVEANGGDIHATYRYTLQICKMLGVI